MKLSSFVTRLSSLALAALLASAVSGCAYVDPGKRNPGRKIDYTRAESIASCQRLCSKLFASEGFKGKYSSKRAEKPAGSLPAIQVAFFDCDDENIRVPSEDFLRLDLEEALANSGWFTMMSGDIDACDYVLRGIYRTMQEPKGGRAAHRISLRIQDIRTGELVWADSDEISKR